MTSKDLDAVSAETQRLIANPKTQPQTWKVQDGAMVGTTGGSASRNSKLVANPVVTKI